MAADAPLGAPGAPYAPSVTVRLSRGPSRQSSAAGSRQSTSQSTREIRQAVKLSSLPPITSKQGRAAALMGASHQLRRTLGEVEHLGPAVAHKEPGAPVHASFFCRTRKRHRLNFRRGTLPRLSALEADTATEADPEPSLAEAERVMAAVAKRRGGRRQSQAPARLVAIDEAAKQVTRETDAMVRRYGPQAFADASREKTLQRFPDKHIRSWAQTRIMRQRDLRQAHRELRRIPRHQRPYLYL